MVRVFLFSVVLVILFVGCNKSEPATNAQILFYQCPMHPWIKADHPDKCTICGMALVPATKQEAAEEDDGAHLMLPNSSIQVMGVTTAPVTVGKLTKTLRLAGVLDDDAGRHRVVSAHFDGRVERPFIEQVGEEVRAGQPLVEIYSPELLYVVREYQRARAANDRSLSDVSARRLIQFGLTVEQLPGLATQSPDRFGVDILSPITGTVITRFVNAGQYVKTGEPLFELGDFSKMWFHATLYESDFPLVTIGQKAWVTSPAAPGETFDGIVTLVNQNFDPVTRSTTARIEVPNPMLRTTKSQRRALPHRAFGEAALVSEVGEGLLVPRSAVLDTGRQAIVYVEKTDVSYERRQIVIAGRGDGMVLVKSGLAAGENVVTQGNLLMDAESQIKDAGREKPLLLQAPKDSPSPSPSTPSQITPFIPLLQAIANVGSALAADDLATYQKAVMGLHVALPELPANSSPKLRQAFLAMEKARHLSGKENTLAEARVAYLPLSEAAAEFTLLEQETGAGVGEFTVYACPMTSTAFPGAPAKARWIQYTEPLQNPWFGTEMLECGAKIQPGAKP